MNQRAGLRVSRIAALCLLLTTIFFFLAHNRETRAVLPVLLFAPLFVWLYAAPLIRSTERERLLTISSLVGLATLLLLNLAKATSIFTLWDAWAAQYVHPGSRLPSLALLSALIALMGATLSHNRIAVSIAALLVPAAAAWRFMAVMGEPPRRELGVGLVYSLNSLFTLGFCIFIALTAFLILLSRIPALAWKAAALQTPEERQAILATVANESRQAARQSDVEQATAQAAPADSKRPIDHFSDLKDRVVRRITAVATNDMATFNSIAEPQFRSVWLAS